MLLCTMHASIFPRIGVRYLVLCGPRYHSVGNISLPEPGPWTNAPLELTIYYRIYIVNKGTPLEHAGLPSITSIYGSVLKNIARTRNGISDCVASMLAHAPALGVFLHTVPESVLRDSVLRFSRTRGSGFLVRGACEDRMHD